jgi:hypothetical protein
VVREKMAYETHAGIASRSAYAVACDAATIDAAAAAGGGASADTYYNHDDRSHRQQNNYCRRYLIQHKELLIFECVYCWLTLLLVAFVLQERLNLRQQMLQEYL